MSTPAARAALKVQHELHGVVVSCGKMERTVKVRIGGQKWNNIVKKTFAKPKHYLVHDPNSSLRLGDVVAIAPGWRTSQQKRHVVKHIIAPHGTPISERPPIPSIADLIQTYEEKRAAKVERRTARNVEKEEQAKKEREEKLLKKQMKEQRRLPAQEENQRSQQTTSLEDVD
ncbi:hypothetical protein S7711_06384 [Stachybotrys chartarum IBT 7711]|uniref:Ribosomal protein S17 n=1 Tax=Stachybotrys chartarum (strain CBS 109288 / IBT 7711) TaxID=1280523 RepID=A0A084AGC6_STACB|nr:hypothetical protein S7711_06384 [Stachybotrys chartarum IBT 7711]KFA45801.1 hypothetical protein S40293_07360 [Stachybotrys chartarum IBT 40293]KFA72383.1 hypothetical protein S40288_05609 [Stachybotrys chartarum IBT 40288]